MKKKWIPVVGEVVMVYAFWLAVGYTGKKGKIISIKDDGLQVKLEDSTTVFAHIKQCRRLVKRERKRIWVAIPTRSDLIPLLFNHPPETKTDVSGLYVKDTTQRDWNDWILVSKLTEYIEVRRK